MRFFDIPIVVVKNDMSREERRWVSETEGDPDRLLLRDPSWTRPFDEEETGQDDEVQTFATLRPL